ncbi:MAG: RluA family pseudouridine synthase [Chitinophagaceae bacterium]|nr:RluA family pseudouridine synthase [Polaromonas sp.]
MDVINVIHVDPHLLVLNKPAGLLCVPGRGEDKQDCLSAWAQHRYPDALVVHRLDMGTSGLVLMARSAVMQRALSQLFEQRSVQKRYVAIVQGQLNSTDTRIDTGEKVDEEGWRLIDLPIALDWPNRPLRRIDAVLGKPSQTRWKLISFDSVTQTSRLELAPITGRSHQLRVHLQALGHPILGDALYAPAEVQAKAPRLLLHASALSFVHPATGEQATFDCLAAF